MCIRDRETKKKIKESFDEEKRRSSQIVEEPKKSKYMSFKLEGILESPVNLCVTYDPTKFGPFVIGRSSIPEAGLYSVCCAIQNLWLSARTEGVGLGWVSILSNEILKDALNLPEHVVPVAYLCLGYVNEFADNNSSTDILVLNTGGPPIIEFEKITKEDWDKYHNQLFVGFCTLLQKIKINDGGYVFAITSNVIKEPNSKLIISSAYRAAFSSVFKILSKEFASRGVTMINIAPGPINTDRTKELIDLSLIHI